MTSTSRSSALSRIRRAIVTNSRMTVQTRDVFGSFDEAVVFVPKNLENGQLRTNKGTFPLNNLVLTSVRRV